MRFSRASNLYCLRPLLIRVFTKPEASNLHADDLSVVIFTVETATSRLTRLFEHLQFHPQFRFIARTVGVGMAVPQATHTEVPEGWQSGWSLHL